MLEAATHFYEESIRDTSPNPLSAHQKLGTIILGAVSRYNVLMPERD